MKRLQARRARRRERDQSMVDLNLVSLIDIFTILIFFLLANASEVEVLPNTRAVRLPESTAEKPPRPTVVVVVNGNDIVVQGRKIASVPEVMAGESEVIAALKTELDYQSGRPTLALAGANAAATADATVEKDITIMGDRDIPYKLLRKVMLTCAQANYSKISFAVMQRAHG